MSQLTFYNVENSVRESNLIMDSISHTQEEQNESYTHTQDFTEQFIEQYSILDVVREEEIKLPRVQIEDIINKQDVILFIDELKCPICLDIIEDPKTCNQCEANFCGVCIQNSVRNGDAKCPICRQESENQHVPSTFYVINSRHSKQFEKGSKIIKKLLSIIQIFCPNDGCSSIVNYDKRTSHHKECKYQFKKCKNYGCLEMVNEFTKEEHDKVCFYRQEPCQYCQNEFLLQELFEHEEFCEENKQLCLECNEFYQTQSKYQHQDECPNKIIECQVCQNLFLLKEAPSHTELICYKQLYYKSQEQIKQYQLQQKQKDNLTKKFIQDLKSQINYPDQTKIDRKQLLQCIDEYSQKTNPKQLDISNQNGLIDSRKKDIQIFVGNNMAALKKIHKKLQLTWNKQNVNQSTQNLKGVFNYKNQS